jgi:hypothetical protein
VRADQIILQFERDGAGLVPESGLTHRYLWGKAVDQILADETVDDGGAEDVLWTLGDHLNTVRDLAAYDVQNDQTAIANHRVFDAFGSLTSEIDPATGNPASVHCLLAFTGKPFDTDTSLQYNINRWFRRSGTECLTYGLKHKTSITAIDYNNEFKAILPSPLPSPRGRGDFWDRHKINMLLNVRHGVPDLRLYGLDLTPGLSRPTFGRCPERGLLG